MSRRLGFIPVVLLLVCSWQSSSRAQTFHALVVTDQSLWAGWGKYLPNVQWDQTHMFSILSNNVPFERLGYWSISFEAGSPMAFEDSLSGSPKAILDALDKLEVKPNDTLLLYYSGHGEADDKGHYLSLEKGKLSRSLLLYKMKGKGARLTVLLTDCCNVRSDGQAYETPFKTLKEPRQATPAFQSLFFDVRGVVDVNSSAPGQSSYFFMKKDANGMHQGSLFSRTLTNYLEEHERQRLSWDQVLQAVGGQVQEAFRENYPNGATMAKGPRRQTAQTVYPIVYPGMASERGPRTGLTIRDHAGPGVLITAVRPWSAGANAYDLAAKKYVPLKSNQVIVIANGKPVKGATHFREMVDSTKDNVNGYKVMRLEIAEPGAQTKTCLLRLSH